MKNTEEQEAIIAASQKSKSLVVNALAGSGKTSTAISCVKANAKKNRIVYLCFNKSVAVSMDEKLKRDGIRGPVISTLHSLAFQAVGKHMLSEGKKIGDLKPYDIEPMRLVEVRDKRAIIRTMKLVLDLFSRWCGSNATEIRKFLERPFPLEIASQMKAIGMDAGVLSDAVIKLWEIMTGENAPMLPHNVYMKLFHLELSKKRRKDYDLVIVDEAQDLFPVTEAVVRIMRKNGSRIMVLGDRYQQIYTWNGSVNSIQNFENESDVLSLTQSFRCPAHVVEESERYLRVLGFTGKFRPAPAECHLRHKSPIIISRTNTSLLANICSCGLDYRKIHLVGGVNSYNFDAIRDYLHFMSGERGKIRSPVVAKMNDVADYDAYVEATNDVEMKHAQTVVRSLGKKKSWDILVSASKNEFAETPMEAELCLSTGHKCKGSEFESVQIDASFAAPASYLAQTKKTPGNFPKGALPVPAEELRLAYVSLTRSTKTLYAGTLAIGEKEENLLVNALESGKAVLVDLDEDGNMAPVPRGKNQKRSES